MNSDILLYKGGVYMADRAELLKEYRKLAKRADQRLVRLERYSEEENFQTATKWAYARAMRDIKQWSGEEATRFNTKPPENMQQLQAKINDIKQFLESKTSTKVGIIKVYKQKADTVNKEYGTDFTWDDLADFYTSGIAEKLNKIFGSKTVLKAVAVIQKSKKEIVDAIKENKEKHLRVKDPIVENTVNKILNDQNIDISMLL